MSGLLKIKDYRVFASSIPQGAIHLDAKGVGKSGPRLLSRAQGCTASENIALRKDLVSALAEAVPPADKLKAKGGYDWSALNEICSELGVTLDTKGKLIVDRKIAVKDLTGEKLDELLKKFDLKFDTLNTVAKELNLNLDEMRQFLETNYPSTSKTVTVGKNGYTSEWELHDYNEYDLDDLSAKYRNNPKKLEGKLLSLAKMIKDYEPYTKYAQDLNRSMQHPAMQNQMQNQNARTTMLTAFFKNMCWGEAGRLFPDSGDYTDVDAATVCKGLANQLVEDGNIPRTAVEMKKVIGDLKMRLAMGSAVRTLLNDHVTMRLHAYEKKLIASCENEDERGKVKLKLGLCRDRAIECLEREPAYKTLSSKIGGKLYGATGEEFVALVKETQDGVDKLCKDIDSALNRIYNKDACMKDKQEFSTTVIKNYAKDLLRNDDSYKEIKRQAGELDVKVDDFINAEVDRLLAGLEQKTLVDVLHKVRDEGVSQTIKQKLTDVANAYNAKAVVARLAKNLGWVNENDDDLARVVDSSIKRNAWRTLVLQLCDPNEQATPKDLVENMIKNYVIRVKDRWATGKDILNTMFFGVKKVIDDISTPEKAANLNVNTSEREKKYTGFVDRLNQGVVEIEKQARQFALGDQVTEKSIKNFAEGKTNEITGECIRFLKECSAKSLDTWKDGFLDALEKYFSGPTPKGGAGVGFMTLKTEVKIGSVDSQEKNNLYLPVLRSAVKAIAEDWIDKRKTEEKTSDQILKRDEEFDALKKHVLSVLKDEGTGAKLATLIKSFADGMSKMDLCLLKDYAKFRTGGAVSFATTLAGRLETAFAAAVLSKNELDAKAVFENERKVVVQQFNQYEIARVKGYLSKQETLKEQAIDSLRKANPNLQHPLSSAVVNVMKTFLEMFYKKYVTNTSKESTKYSPVSLDRMQAVAITTQNRYKELADLAGQILADKTIPGLAVNEAREAFVKEHIAKLIDPLVENGSVSLLYKDGFNKVVNDCKSCLTELLKGTSPLKELSTAYQEAVKKDKTTSTELAAKNYSIDRDLEQIKQRAGKMAETMTVYWRSALSNKWPQAYYGVNSESQKGEVTRIAEDVQKLIVDSLRVFVEDRREKSPETFSGREVVAEFFKQLNDQAMEYGIWLHKLHDDLHKAANTAGWKNDEMMPQTMERVYEQSRVVMSRIAKGQLFKDTGYEEFGTKEVWVQQIKGDIVTYEREYARTHAEEMRARKFIDENFLGLQDGIVEAFRKAVAADGVSVDFAARTMFEDPKMKDWTVHVIEDYLKGGGTDLSVQTCVNRVVDKLSETNHLLDVIKGELRKQAGAIVARFKKDLDTGARRSFGLGATSIDAKFKSYLGDLYYEVIAPYKPGLSTEKLLEQVRNKVAAFEDRLDKTVFPQMGVSPFSGEDGETIEWKDVTFEMVAKDPNIFEGIDKKGICYYETEGSQITTALKAKKSCDLFGAGYGKAFKGNTVQGFKTALAEKFKKKKWSGVNGVYSGFSEPPSGGIRYSIPSLGVNHMHNGKDQLEMLTNVIKGFLVKDPTAKYKGDGDADRNIVQFLTTIMTGGTFDLVSSNLGEENGAFQVETGKAADGTINEGRCFSLSRDGDDNIVLSR